MLLVREVGSLVSCAEETALEFGALVIVDIVERIVLQKELFENFVAVLLINVAALEL